MFQAFTILSSKLAAKSTHAEHQSRETSESLTKTKTDFGKVYLVLAQVIAWNDSLFIGCYFSSFFSRMPSFIPAGLTGVPTVRWIGMVCDSLGHFASYLRCLKWRNHLWEHKGYFNICPWKIFFKLRGISRRLKLAFEDVLGHFVLFHGSRIKGIRCYLNI